MEIQKELAAKILSITTKIQENYPELSKYLNEMPDTFSNENKPSINSRNLEEYYESLQIVLKKYMLEHTEGLPDIERNVLQSHPRPDADRLLDTPMFTIDLPSAIERIKQEAEWLSGKHNAITLMKSEMMRIVLIAIHKGNEMKMHQSDGPISLQILEGKLKFIAEDMPVVLTKGQLITLHENIKHGLIAIEETTFLLTMVNLQSK